MVIPSLRKILFLFMLSGRIVNAADNSTYNAMLSSDDLRYFVNAIDNIVSYVERNTTALRLPNFMFGLFLSNGKYYNFNIKFPLVRVCVKKYLIYLLYFRK